MTLINFYKGLESAYDSSLHNNSIYQCTDSGVVYILGTKHEKISKEEIDNIVGSNTYTGANYISKETNLTDAVLQLDEEIKATNDNLAILNAATIKGIKLANRPIAETPTSGIVTIPAASSTIDYGLMSALDKSKIDNLLSSGDGTKFLADDFTYKSIDATDIPDLSSKYLPLSGGTMTGNIILSGNRGIDYVVSDGTLVSLITTIGDSKNILIGNDSVPEIRLSTTGSLYRVTYNNDPDKKLIYDSGNFVAGTNYVAPSTLNNYALKTDLNNWYIIEQTEDYNLTDKNGITYYNNGVTPVDNNPGGSYGVVATVGNLNTGNTGTSDTWGFQLAKANDSDYLKYREFTGLTIGNWKELATVDQINNLQLEDIVSYGIEWDTEVSDPDCTRIGNLSLHKSLPIQNKMRGCVAKGNKIQYYLNPTDWSQKEDGTPSVLDGTDGDVMVHIPKFWIKSGSSNTKRWVKIATNYIDETWTEVPEMLISAYRVTTDRTDAENIKLMSVVNNTQNFAGSFGVEDPTNTYRTALGKPRTSMSRSTARTYAHNKQDGTELLCYEYYKDVLYWLPVIEYATFNIQQAFNDELTSEGYHQGGLGSGVTNLSTYIWKSYGNSYYPITPMGYTNDLGNFTGTKELNLGTYSFTSKTSTSWNAWSHNYDYVAHTVDGAVMTVTNVMADGYACYVGFYDVGGDMTVTIQGLQEGQSIIFRASGMEDVEVSTNEQVVIPWPQSNVSRYIYFGFTGECNITLTIDANLAVEYNDIDGGTTNVIRYRGIENIFGDIWTNLEGVIIRYDNHASGTHDVYTTTNSEYFQDSATDNMELIGTETASTGYVKEFNLGDKANIIPSICTGASSTTYKCDYHYTVDLGSNLGALLAGGLAYDGAVAGLGSLSSPASTAVSSVDVGFRTVNILN